MTVHRIAIGVAGALLLAGCSGGSKYAQRPVWVSGSLNGLQQSQCNCGGVEGKKQFEKRREAEFRAQEMQRLNRLEMDGDE